jgi:hypothetical protein
VSQHLKPVQAEIGKAARFVCQFDGAQPINVTWFKDGVPISSSFGLQVKSGICLETKAYLLIVYNYLNIKLN